MKDNDRAQKLLKGKDIDRMPLFPFLLGFCAKNVGYSLASIYSDAKASFDAQLKTLDQYAFDWGPTYGYASYGTWEFGGKVSMPTESRNQAPAHVNFPVQSEEDIAKLQLPDVKTAGCLPIAMEFSQLQKNHGKPISVVCGAAFTTAGNICPVEMLCRWMLKKPELAHNILKLATDHIVDVVRYWADIFGAEKVIPQFWEPLAANFIISPDQFKIFVLPYLKEASERILSMGVKHILYHICGDQNKNLEYWAEVPMGDPGLCSFGNETEISLAIKFLGNSSIIIGNIDTVTILSDKPDAIYNLCKEAIEEGKNAPRGFMLSSACEVPPATPPYNVFMMSKAILDFGKM